MHAKCSDCGIDHVWQLVNFPVGTKCVVVEAIRFPIGLKPDDTMTIPLMVEGEVIDHCDDGRAVVQFPELYGNSTHTFHRITDFLLKADSDEPKGVIDAQN